MNEWIWMMIQCWDRNLWNLSAFVDGYSLELGNQRFVMSTGELITEQPTKKDWACLKWARNIPKTCQKRGSKLEFPLNYTQHSMSHSSKKTEPSSAPSGCSCEWQLAGPSWGHGQMSKTLFMMSQTSLNMFNFAEIFWVSSFSYVFHEVKSL